MVIWVLGLSLIAAHVMVTGAADVVIQASRGQTGAQITATEVAQVVGGFVLIMALALWAEASPDGGTIAVLLLVGLWIGWGLRNLAWIQSHIGKALP